MMGCENSVSNDYLLGHGQFSGFALNRPVVHVYGTSMLDIAHTGNGQYAGEWCELLILCSECCATLFAISLLVDWGTSWDRTTNTADAWLWLAATAAGQSQLTTRGGVSLSNGQPRGLVQPTWQHRAAIARHKMWYEITETGVDDW